MDSYTRDNEELDQGSVIYGFRSEKYPETGCYGVIITASCDVAQCKVPKFYCLVAVEAKEWFLTDVGYAATYEDKINNNRMNLETCAQKHELSGAVLMNLAEEELLSVLETEVHDSRGRNEIKKYYDCYWKYVTANKDATSRKDMIRSNDKPVSDIIKKIDKGQIVHYYFLPQAAYLKNGVKNAGLIVDLQEIEILSLCDAQMIVEGKTDNMILSEEEKKRLNSHFWLKEERDFVAIMGKIQSPWREHMMQRFSYAFTRIGLDGATRDDYEEFAKGI